MQVACKTESISASEGESIERSCTEAGSYYLWFNCTENDVCRSMSSKGRIEIGYNLKINDIRQTDINRYM